MSKNYLKLQSTADPIQNLMFRIGAAMSNTYSPKSKKACPSNTFTEPYLLGMKFKIHSRDILAENTILFTMFASHASLFKVSNLYTLNIFKGTYYIMLLDDWKDPQPNIKPRGGQTFTMVCKIDTILHFS